MQKKEPDNNNLLIAVILSMAVLMAWQLLYAGPKMREEARQERAKQEQVQPQVAKPGEAAPPRQPESSPPRQARRPPPAKSRPLRCGRPRQ